MKRYFVTSSDPSRMKRYCLPILVLFKRSCRHSPEWNMVELADAGRLAGVSHIGNTIERYVSISLASARQLEIQRHDSSRRIRMCQYRTVSSGETLLYVMTCFLDPMRLSGSTRFAVPF